MPPRRADGCTPLGAGCMDLLLMRDANRSDALSMLLDSDKIAEHPAVQYQRIKVRVHRPLQEWNARAVPNT